MSPELRVIILLAFQPVAWAVWRWQNSRPDRLGGPISLVKAFWLVYAISLWIILPVLWWGEHRVFQVWALSMGVRVLVEIPLCLTRTWKVAYGLAHDGIHLVLVAWGWVAHPALWAVAALTVLSLITEMVFVGWFRRSTEGPESGIYFVSGGDEYRALNRKTSWIFLPQYVAFVIWSLAQL